MKRRIHKVAVIGSGIMGSGIACHFANIGVEVLLLDIIPNKLDDRELSNGLTLEDKSVRNRIVNNSLKATLKSKPSPIYDQKFAGRIATGNLEDDLELLKHVDWIIEVVVERLDIKKQVLINPKWLLEYSIFFYSHFKQLLFRPRICNMIEVDNFITYIKFMLFYISPLFFNDMVNR